MENNDEEDTNLNGNSLPPVSDKDSNDSEPRPTNEDGDLNPLTPMPEISNDTEQQDNSQDGLEIHHVIKAEDAPTNHFADAHLAPAMEIPSSDITISKYEEHPNNSSLNEHGDIDLTRPDSATSTQYQASSADDTLGQDLSLETTVSPDTSYNAASPYSEGEALAPQSLPDTEPLSEPGVEQPASLGAPGPTEQSPTATDITEQPSQITTDEQITGSLAPNDQLPNPPAGLEPASENVKKGPSKIIWIIIAVVILLILIPVIYFTVILKQSLGSQAGRSNDVKRASHARSLISAINLYRNENADKCPPSLEVLTPEYINTIDTSVVGDKYTYKVDGDKCVVSIAVEVEKSLEDYKDEISNNGNVLDYVSNGILNYEN